MFHAHGKLGRIVAAVALTTVLSLAGPVRADTAVGRVSPADPWSWLKGWWQGGIASLVQDLTGGAPATPSFQLKDAPPPGQHCGPSPCSSPQQGGGLDPDGKP